MLCSTVLLLALYLGARIHKNPNRVVERHSTTSAEAESMSIAEGIVSGASLGQW